ncbi:MAG: helix-turn-helix transcriptional regulator, partial [Bacteroidales bacterium]|nr:helix-turn-helix transcriptional regulator [Bacteroidales bacterium]
MTAQESFIGSHINSSGGRAVSHDNNNREKILAAARMLMAEKGIMKTSLADIAREVGISKG